MILHDIFINDAGRPRSGWRLIVYFAAVIALTLILGVALRGIYVVGLAVAPRIPYAEFVADIIFRLTLLLSALGAAFLCLKYLEGLPLRSLGLGLHKGFLRDLLVGSVIGAVTVAFAVLIAVVMGGLKLTVNGDVVSAIAKSLIASGGLLLIAALAEEVMFRGYPLQTLSRARLAWLGALLTSVPFGLVHLKNPNVIPGITFTNTALAGIWLVVAYLRTRSLWFPWGVHWAWNFALGGLFGLPISGLKVITHPLLKAEDLGPRWLTGGNYGIEGGIACTIALVLSTVIIWFIRWPPATPELKKMTSEENPASSASLR